jgi:hypothetical protein
MPDQGGDVKNIENLMKIVVPVSKHPEVPEAEFYKTHVPKPHPKGFLYRGMRSGNSRRFRRR